jgi:hypothetical protein
MDLSQDRLGGGVMMMVMKSGKKVKKSMLSET